MIEQHKTLIGTIQSQIDIAGTISTHSNLQGTIAVPDIVKVPVVEGVEFYDGEYEFEALAFDDTVVPTKETYLKKDITIKAIPHFEVSNESGKTFIIGG